MTMAMAVEPKDGGVAFASAFPRSPLPDDDDGRVTFEEHLYYASATRAAEEQRAARRGPAAITTGGAPGPSAGGSGPAAVTEAEWTEASRALRTAGWGSVFYLIATDVLGPSQVPWSFAQLGYGPAFAMYTVFGFLSGYSGFLLWRLFLALDSDRYPVRNFADVFGRLFGPAMRHFVNVAQTVQLVVVLGFIVLLNGQGIAQMARGPPDGDATPGRGLCFIACLVLFCAAGFIVSQIRTLQHFAWLANIGVFFNLLVVVVVMALAANYAPNFDAVMASFGPQWVPGPVMTFGGPPPPGFATGGAGFVAAVNGLNQTMLVYGGAALFVFFMAEMRHPLDFWKSILCAQLFIYVMYIVFGTVVYHYHGQYTYAPAIQGVSHYKWQTALNVINLFMNLVACGLFGNIGLKIAYIEVLEKLLRFPPLHTRAGKVWWAVLAPVYWILGFIVAAAVPQFALVSGLTGAVFGVLFTYILPALGMVAFRIRRDAIMGETERFDPATGTFHYADRGVRRYVRGFMRRPVLNSAHIVYFLGGLVTCGLGCYAAITQLMVAFASGTTTSFTCTSPV